MRTNDDKERFFVEIYFLYACKLEHMCLKYVGYREEYRCIVDESIQETFLQAVKNFDKLNGFTPPHLEGWLVQTCWNRFRPEVRKYRRRKKRYVAFPDKGEPYLSPEQLQTILERYFEELHNQEIIDRLLQILNERERDAVNRYFLQGLSFEEMAKQDAITVGAVKSVLARAKAKLKKAAKKDFRFFLFFSYLFCLLCTL
jgi:RNA polymerase sigma factor (sigma-70 family)